MHASEEGEEQHLDGAGVSRQVVGTSVCGCSGTRRSLDGVRVRYESGPAGLAAS